MASIYYLNHPADCFWEDLITALEDHPFFACRNHHHARPHWGWGGHGNLNDWGCQSNDTAGGAAACRAPGQTTEPAAGPSAPDSHKTKEASTSAAPESDKDQYRGGDCDKGKHHKGRYGPRHHHHGVRGPHGTGAIGDLLAHLFCEHPRGQRLHDRGLHGGRSWHHDGPGFNFLRNLAAQFGILFNEPTQEGIDFVPSVDVFETPAEYIVHVSLPGAKKDDLSIDYDADESILRLAGVVYRPGVDEALHQALVMGERAREVGVFEREVCLGTRASPAAVSVDGITARLDDGVLSVVLPKIATEHETKKKVFVEDCDAEGKERDALNVDEGSSVCMTPAESDSGEEGEESREYVNVPVQ